MPLEGIFRRISIIPIPILVAVYDSSVEKGEKIEEEYGVKAYKNLSEDVQTHPGLEAAKCVYAGNDS